MAIQSFSVRRYEDIGVNYDLDFSQYSIVLRQRIYKSQNGEIETPITSLFLVRQYSGNQKPPIARSFNPRTAISCFSNADNTLGFTNLRTIIPYRPIDDNIKRHIQEIINYQNVESVSYQGEQHSRTQNF